MPMGASPQFLWVQSGRKPAQPSRVLRLRSHGPSGGVRMSIGRVGRAIQVLVENLVLGHQEDGVIVAHEHGARGPVIDPHSDPGCPQADVTARRLAAAGVIITICVMLLSACGSKSTDSSFSAALPPTEPTAGTGNEPTSIFQSTGDGSSSSTALPPTEPTAGTGNEPTSIFQQADAAIARLVDASVEWRSPPRLTVDETADIGLAIGGGQRLRDEIEKNLPNTLPSPLGTISVGPVVRATLLVNPADATVEPHDAIDASTPSDVALLWTWKLHPLHPDDSLTVTALVSVSVPGTNYSVTHQLPLRLPVDRTLQYTAYQFFSNWATWAAIAGITLIPIGRWLRRKYGRASGPRGSGNAKHADLPRSRDATAKHVLAAGSFDDAGGDGANHR